MKTEKNLNNNGRYKIKLHYFKESGKYYTTEKCYSEEELMSDIEKDKL